MNISYIYIHVIFSVQIFFLDGCGNLIKALKISHKRNSSYHCMSYRTLKNDTAEDKKNIAPICFVANNGFEIGYILQRLLLGPLRTLTQLVKSHHLIWILVDLLRIDL